VGTLNFSKEKEHLAIIRKRLAVRGLKPDLKSEWEIHGPHQDMNYQVYVGYAMPSDDKEECRYCSLPWKQCKVHPNYYCVVIYPRGVFEIFDPSKWYKPEPENRIGVV